MLKRWFLACMTLSVLLLNMGCGISQEEYAAAVAERDAAQDLVPFLKSELDQLENEVERTQVEKDTLERDVDKTESQIASLQEDLTAAKERLERMEDEFGRLLFFEDFEYGGREVWSWSDAPGEPPTEQSLPIIMENNNNVLLVDGHKLAKAGSGSWTDYIFQARIKLLQNAASMLLKSSVEGNYHLFFYTGGLFLHKSFNMGQGFASLCEYSHSYNLNQWYEIRVAIDSDSFKIYVDGVLTVECKDPEPLRYGAISFGGGDDITYYVDNIAVTTDK